MYLTTRGLVLREAKYKESDKILTILTETDGKISAKARGVQRTRSKIAAASQLLSFSDFTFFGSRGKWTINEAESLEQFRALRGDIELLALGSYIAELLEAVANENVPEPEILQLGLNALYALSNRLCPPGTRTLWAVVCGASMTVVPAGMVTPPTTRGFSRVTNMYCARIFMLSGMMPP